MISDIADNRFYGKSGVIILISFIGPWGNKYCVSGFTIYDLRIHGEISIVSIDYRLTKRIPERVISRKVADMKRSTRTVSLADRISDP